MKGKVVKMVLCPRKCLNRLKDAKLEKLYFHVGHPSSQRRIELLNIPPNKSMLMSFRESSKP